MHSPPLTSQIIYFTTLFLFSLIMRRFGIVLRQSYRPTRMINKTCLFSMAQFSGIVDTSLQPGETGFRKEPHYRPKYVNNEPKIIYNGMVDKKIAVSKSIHNDYRFLPSKEKNPLFIYYYEGEWENNRPHGKGKLIMPNGNQYIGEIQEGRIHGHGIERNKYGIIYEGNWESNIKHGHGQMKYIDDAVYTGTYRSGKRHGRGKHLLADGSYYEGGFADDKKHGTGVIKQKDEKYFSVIYKHGIRTKKTQIDSDNLAQGVKLPEGSIYEGMKKYNLPHGNGRCVYPDNSEYNGEWQEGKRHGYGVNTWKDGIYYEGEYFEGLRHGKGKLHLPEGRSWEGFWERNILLGKNCKVKLSNSVIYTGDLVVVNKLGKRVGQYEECMEKPTGKGLVLYPDNSRYEGEFKLGKRHGRGTSYDKEGNVVYEGEWEDDQQQQ